MSDTHNQIINMAILSIYIFVIFAAYLFVASFDLFYAIVHIVVSVPFVILLSCLIVKIVNKISPYKKTYASITSKKVFIFSFVLTFGLLMLCFWGFYPGGFSPDCVDQYRQAVTGKYHDWYPVLHTILFYTIPYKLTGSFNLIIPLQILYFSICASYICMTIYDLLGLNSYILCILFFVLNPNTYYFLMYPYKDVAFAIACTIAYTITIRSIFLKEGFSFTRIIVLSLLIVLASIFRHNGILFTVPLIIALLFYVDKKKYIKLIIISLCLFILIKGPLYSSLGVEKASDRTSETTGLFLTIIGNAVKEGSDKLDDEVLEFAYRISSQEEWETYYIEGNFNSIKWESADVSFLDDYGFFGVMNIAIKCIIEAPYESLRAFFKLTSLVYGIDEVPQYGTNKPGICENEFGMTRSGQEALLYLFETYAININNSIFMKPFGCLGILNLLMIAFILSKHNLKDKNNLLKILLCLPILIYNFGTMLLLTGSDWRFFYISYLICPLVLTISCLKKEEIKI